ncbi:MAG: hypothetical protein JNK60_04475 [Acidobacteria bacterium]|nr:hypothetical protein [Acidobacteriota bacterium]
MIDARTTVARGLLSLVFLGATGPLAAEGPRRGEATQTPAENTDPLAAELGRVAAAVRSTTSTDPMWSDLKGAIQPMLEGAEKAAAGGQRLLALQRLAAAETYLSAWTYLSQRSPKERSDTAAFEAEWARMGNVLKGHLDPAKASPQADLRPALLRALAEAAVPQVKVFYDASLEYGRSTTPDSGLFYLGSAQAQREFADLSRRLAAAFPPAGEMPRLRSLAPEIDELETTLLAAYRPPASIDRHPEFIAASGTLKEARELDALGLRYGALLRLLLAAQRIAPLRAAPAKDTPSRDDLASNLQAAGESLKSGVDDSIARLFVESGLAELSAVAADAPTPKALAALSDILPLYRAALAPRPPVPTKPAPLAVVTLIRWPYT